MPQIADENAVKMAQLINESRAGEGLDPLKIEVHLNDSSRIQAEHMDNVDALTHDGPDGASLLDRVDGADFDLSGTWSISENVGYLQGYGAITDASIAHLHQQFLNSPGHYDNIMNPDSQYAGVHFLEGAMPGPAGPETPTLFFAANFATTEGRAIVQDPESSDLMLYEAGAFVENVAHDRIEAPEQEASDNTTEETDHEPPEPHWDEDDADDGISTAGSSSGCFVATAAYGDRLHPDVVALRRYRDLVMTRTASGRVLIRIYQWGGPGLARVVDPQGWTGQACRTLLGPLSRKLDPNPLIRLGSCAGREGVATVSRSRKPPQA